MISGTGLSWISSQKCFFSGTGPWKCNAWVPLPLFWLSLNTFADFILKRIFRIVIWVLTGPLNIGDGPWWWSKQILRKFWASAWCSPKGFGQNVTTSLMLVRTESRESGDPWWPSKHQLGNGVAVKLWTRFEQVKGSNPRQLNFFSPHLLFAFTWIFVTYRFYYLQLVPLHLTAINQDECSNLNDMEIQVQAKLQDVLKAIKAVVSVHKKGWGKSGEGSNADRVVPSDLIMIPYIQLAVGLSFRGHVSRF